MHWNSLPKANDNYNQKKFNINIIMKLEDQRINTDKSCQSIDPQFLTFRHNSPHSIQPSGRSIYSQRVEYIDLGNSQHSYKSLEKYPFDIHHSERQQVHRKGFNKKNKGKRNYENYERGRQKRQQQIILRPAQTHKNLRNVRSHQKYSDYEHHFQGSIKNCTSKKPNKSAINQEEIDYEAKMPSNEDLKQKLSRLVKNIKRQQNKQINLEKDIESMKFQIIENDRNLQQQEQSLEELEEIHSQNLQECNHIADNLRNIRIRNKQLSEIVYQLDQELDNSEISVETTRQDSLRDTTLYNKLKAGINDLSKIKQSLEQQTSRLGQQVEQLYQKIKELQIFDQQMLNLISRR